MTITAAKTKKLNVESVTEILSDEREDTASPEEATEELEMVLKKDPDTFLKLVHYAHKKIKYFYKGGNIAGYTGMDIVQITLEKIIKGIRKWNRNKIPDFTNFLYVATFSVIRAAHKKEKKFITLDPYDAEGEFDENRFPEFIKKCYAEDFRDKIFGTDFESLLAGLQKDLEEDVNAYFVLEEILEGNDSNIEISAKLGIDIKEVVNAKRRIKYKTDNLIEQQLH